MNGKRIHTHSDTYAGESADMAIDESNGEREEERKQGGTNEEGKGAAISLIDDATTPDFVQRKKKQQHRSARVCEGEISYG